MKKLFLTFIISFSSILQAQTEVETLTKILHQFMEGASDEKTHQNFWAEDLIYTSSSGKRFGKAKIMAGFKEPKKEEVGPKTIFTAEDIQINIYGKTAVVAFKMKGHTGDKIQYYYNSGTFIKRNKRWQVVNWQATIIPN